MNSISGVGAATSYKLGDTDVRNYSALGKTTQARTTEPTPTLTVQFDKVTQQPIVPRFPWLSRLTAELEAAARQRPTFPPTSSMGNNVDKIA